MKLRTLDPRTEKNAQVAARVVDTIVSAHEEMIEGEATYLVRVGSVVTFSWEGGQYRVLSSQPLTETP